MSNPPPYDSNPTNPDKRPLPPGWIEQYDKNYKAWFYVNTNEHPPKSIWVHPSGPPPPAGPPQGFAPPPGPPPPRDSGPSYPPQGWGGPGPGWGGGSPPPGGWGPQGHGGWGGGPPGGWGGSPGWQGPPGGYGGGPPMGGPGPGYYGQPQPQYVAQGKPPKSKSGGIGMGTAVAAGGAGLLGGVLLGEALESHEDHESYQDGFQDGADFDGGGGDW